jgi:ATP-dependent Clp protease adaptor protein ClpS
LNLAIFYYKHFTAFFLLNSAKKCIFATIFKNENRNMAKEQSATKERQHTNLREPRRYKVTIYNDDFTTMEFVVKILTQVFFKSETEAEALMLQVHHSDKAVVGIYSYDVATSKVRKATNMAREEGFPLRLTVEPEE